MKTAVTILFLVLPLLVNAETITAEVTAYTASIEETDEDFSIMASGKEVYSGAAACPIRFTFGTRVTIIGKEYVCEDRMAKRYREGNYFDILVPTKEEAKEWGRKKLQVTITEHETYQSSLSALKACRIVLSDSF